MSTNDVSFSISVDTKPAGKALIDLKKEIEGLGKVHSVDNKTVKQQRELQTVLKGINDATDKAAKTSERFAATTYKRNATRISNLEKENGTLDEQRARTAELIKEWEILAQKKQDAALGRTDTSGSRIVFTGEDVNKMSRLNETIDHRIARENEIAKLKAANARYDSAAEKILRTVLGDEKEIVRDENSILGIKVQKRQLAEQEAVVQNNVTEKIKQASDAEAASASATEKTTRAKKKEGDEAAKTANITKKQDDSLRGLLNTYTEYQAKLEKLQQEGKSTVAVERQITDTADMIRSKFNFSEDDGSISSLVRRLHELLAAKRALESAGVPREFSGQYDYIFSEIERVKHSIQDYKRSLTEVDVAQEQTGKSGASAFSKIRSGLKGAISGLSNVGKIFSTIKSNFNSLTKTTTKLQSALDRMTRTMRSNFKHLITNITKYVLGFRSLFFLVRRLRKYVGEGIKNLAQFNSGNNAVNRSITQLLSSLLYLKNAWAAAFSPIITFVSDWLSVLIDKLAEVGNAVARFIGKLTGQAIVFNAVKVDAQDYASTLDDVGNSAGGAADKTKKLTDRLAAFDDLNVLGKDNDNDGSGGGGGAGDAELYTPDVNDMFKRVAAFSELGRAIRAAIVDGMDFTDVGKTIAERIVTSLRSVNWETLKQGARNIGYAISTFLTGLLGDKAIWLESATAIGDGVNTVFSFVGGLLMSNAKVSYGERARVDIGKNLALFISSIFSTIDWDTINGSIEKFVVLLRDNIASFIKNMRWADVYSAFESFGQMVGNLINDVLGNEEFMGQISRGIAKLVNAGILGINAFLDTTNADDLGSSIATFFRKLFTTIKWDELGKSFGGTAGLLLNTLSAAFEEMPADELSDAIVEWFRGVDWGAVFGAIARIIIASNNALTHFNSAITEAVNELLSDEEFSDTIADILVSIIENIDTTAVTEALVTWTSACFHAVLATPDLIKNVVEGIVKAFVKYFEENSIEDIANELFIGPGKAIVEGLSTGISDAFDDPMEWVRLVLFGPIVNALIDLFEIGSPSKYMETQGGFIVAGLKNGMSAMMPDVEKIFIDFKSWLSDTLYTIRADAVSNFWKMKTNIVEAFTAIKDGIKGVTNNGIIPVVESMVNKIINGLNSMFDKLNGLPDVKITNPFTGTDYTLGINIPKLNTITIPRLAQGAVIPPNREFMAVLGDQKNGTNIEAPLDTIKQAVAEVAGNQEVIQLLQQLITVVENKDLSIGDKAIGQANARYNTQQRLIRGTSF